MTNLKNIESQLTAIMKTQSRDRYGPDYPDPLPSLVLKLCQEVIQLRRDMAGERRDWGRMHT